MATESELRAALRATNQEAGVGSGATPLLDSDAIIRRARRRRRPRQILAGAGTALAVVAVVVVGVNGAQGLFGSSPFGLSTVAGSSHADDSAAPESATGTGDSSLSTGENYGKSGAQRANLCGMPVQQIPEDPHGLSLAVQFPMEAHADGGSLDGTVTLTNSSDQRVTVSVIGAPAITIAAHGTTLWHSHWTQAWPGRRIELAPGESVAFGVQLELVECSSADEGATGFRDSLPTLDPGQYQVSAVLELAGTQRGETRLVSGPAQALSLD